MTKQAEFIKAALIVMLEDKGSSLAECEQLMKQGMEKQAVQALVDPRQLGDILKGIANFGTLTALGVGGAGGYGAYKAYDALASGDEDRQKQLQEKAQYDNATKSLLQAQQQMNTGAF